MPGCLLPFGGGHPAASLLHSSLSRERTACIFPKEIAPDRIPRTTSTWSSLDHEHHRTPSVIHSRPWLICPNQARRRHSERALRTMPVPPVRHETRNPALFYWSPRDSLAPRPDPLPSILPIPVNAREERSRAPFDSLRDRRSWKHAALVPVVQPRHSSHRPFESLRSLPL